MKVYLASSWKNAELCRIVACLFRQNSIETYCFSDDHSCNFKWTDLGDLSKYDIRTVLTRVETRKPFDLDLAELLSSKCTVLILPAGKSAHLEAGYTKGAGRKLFVWAAEGLRNETFENMYHLADGIFDKKELNMLIAILKEMK